MTTVFNFKGPNYVEQPIGSNYVPIFDTKQRSNIDSKNCVFSKCNQCICSTNMIDIGCNTMMICDLHFNKDRSGLFLFDEGLPPRQMTFLEASHELHKQMENLHSMNLNFGSSMKLDSTNLSEMIPLIVKGKYLYGSAILSIVFWNPMSSPFFELEKKRNGNDVFIVRLECLDSRSLSPIIVDLNQIFQGFYLAIQCRGDFGPFQIFSNDEHSTIEPRLDALTTQDPCSSPISIAMLLSISNMELDPDSTSKIQHLFYLFMQYILQFFQINHSCILEIINQLSFGIDSPNQNGKNIQRLLTLLFNELPVENQSEKKKKISNGQLCNLIKQMMISILVIHRKRQWLGEYFGIFFFLSLRLLKHICFPENHEFMRLREKFMKTFEEFQPSDSFPTLPHNMLGIFKPEAPDIVSKFNQSEGEFPATNI
jgi:hypothetical protein